MISPAAELDKFIAFISKGNVIDLAVGTIIGGAFTNIVTSFTKDLLGPLLELVSAHDMEDAFYVVKAGKNAPYKSLKQARDDGAVAISWGKFAQATINFLLQAICVFLLVRAVDNIRTVPLKAILTGKNK